MAITLPPREPRLGWFIDGLEDTPEVAVMLENTGSEIVLTVPTKGMFGDNSPYRRWFAFGTQFGDDPDRTRFTYAPPEVCLYYDGDGHAVLVGCRARSAKSNLQAGVGKITAQYAVLGGKNLKYSTLNGVRVGFPALIPWTGIRSIQVESQTDAQGRLETVTATAASPPASHLAKAMNLSLRPTFRTEYPNRDDSFSMRGGVELATMTRSPRTWSDHMGPIAAVRDLLVISAWAPLGFSGIKVNRGDDPDRVLSDDAVGENWADVVTHRWPVHEEWPSDLRFLFSRDDIGSGGIHRWLRLRRDFDRGMYRMVAIADGKITGLDAAIVETAIALEAIGYELAVAKGTVARGVSISYESCLQHVLDDMNHVPVGVDWAHNFNSVYKGVKHADNSVPDWEDARLELFRGLLVFRCWVASRLGVKKRTLEKRLRSLPMAQGL